MLDRNVNILKSRRLGTFVAFPRTRPLSTRCAPVKETDTGNQPLVRRWHPCLLVGTAMSNRKARGTRRAVAMTGQTGLQRSHRPYAPRPGGDHRWRRTSRSRSQTICSRPSARVPDFSRLVRPQTPNPNAARQCQPRQGCCGQRTVVESRPSTLSSSASIRHTPATISQSGLNSLTARPLSTNQSRTEEPRDNGRGTRS